MPTVQIRELPEPIYRKLRQTADSEHRSLSQQAVVLLARALEESEIPRERRRRVLERVTENPMVKNTEGLPAPEDLIREDRER